jgi:hypothetical protein
LSSVMLHFTFSKDGELSTEKLRRPPESSD